MALNAYQLGIPTLAVHAERLVATLRRDLVEPRFDDLEQRAVGRVSEPELNQRRRLFRVIDICIDGVRVPPVCEELLRISLTEAWE